MIDQEKINFDRISAAITYLKSNFKNQPDLEEVAAKVHMSPFHFQKLFTSWAGTSPKNFLQFITAQYAKSLLKDHKATLFDTAIESGLSGTSRLHDLFIKMEGMSPAEFKNGGESLFINYSFAESPFGNLIIASTLKGICHMAFYSSENEGLLGLQSKFPNALFTEKPDIMQQNALSIFKNDWRRISEIKLHLKGTPFQLKVWEALLKIPMGKLSTYGTIAKEIKNPDASRAVGTAIGSNPIAYLIPCHRVIQSTGEFGGYMWGPERKTAILGWELCHADENKL